MKSENFMLSLEEGKTLVKAARTALTFHLSGQDTDLTEKAEGNLLRPGGAFVSLLDASRNRSLRGCIGNPLPNKPLIEQTAISAVEAATMDPRFRPLKLTDLPNLIIEVTVLSHLEEVSTNRPVDLPKNIVVGKHGLMVEGGISRGLLLPQVAVDERFDSEEFLSQCCIKAGLFPDAWLTEGTRVFRFEGQVFSEETPKGPVLERRLHSART